ncbi:MAG: hypothetical protein Q7K44_03965 [Candidatus Liptonbacteria bacterium]|nr:hypothetical protein [Candidatus Liptonbacteria bacterium]
MPKNLGNTQDLVELESVQDDTLILKDGSLRQIIMVGGVNFSLKSEAEQDTITYSYQNFLNSLDFPIQTIIHSRKINIESYLGLLDRRIKEEPTELLQNQIGEYKEFIASFVKDNPIMAKTFLVVIPFFSVQLPNKQTISRFIPFFGKKTTAENEKAVQEKSADIEKSLEQLRQRTSQVIEGLQAIDLEVKTLNNEELIELFYNFYNPSTVEKGKIASNDSKNEDGKKAGT